MKMRRRMSGEREKERKRAVEIFSLRYQPLTLPVHSTRDDKNGNVEQAEKHGGGKATIEIQATRYQGKL